MASQFQSLAALVQDDTGTPDSPNGDGTQINSTLFAAFDAILNEFLTRSAKTVGGVWTWETAGQHSFSGGASPANRLLVRNTSAGTSNYAAFTLGNNAQEILSDFAVMASNASVSGHAAPNRTILAGYGDNGLAVVATHANGQLFWFAHNRFMLNMRLTSGVEQLRLSPVVANELGSQVIIGGSTTSPATAIVQSGHPGLTADVANFGNNYGALSSTTSGRFNTSIGGGYFSVFSTGAANYYHVSNTGTVTQLWNTDLVGSSASLMVGGGSRGVHGSLELLSGATSPISGQVLFGGDGSGWELRFGRNNAGVITHYWGLTDTGHLKPILGGAYDIGTAALRPATIYGINIRASSDMSCNSLLATTIVPSGDASGTIGTSSLRYAALHVVDANFGDASFDNQWSITEGEKVGLGSGLAFVNAKNDLCMFIDNQGNLFVNQTKPLHLLLDTYRRLTKEERLSKVNCFLKSTDVC